MNSVVGTLSDNGKLANQIATLQPLVVKSAIPDGFRLFIENGSNDKRPRDKNGSKANRKVETGN